MVELYALYNVKANKFLVTDRSYEMLKTIQFLFAHRILFYCIRLNDVRGYRDGLFSKGRHAKLGLADPQLINISTDIHPKSDGNIKFVSSPDKNDVHTKFSKQAEFYKDFLRVFNKEYGYFQDIVRTRSRTQKNGLTQLTEYTKFLMPDDEALRNLISQETDYNFSVMKYLRQFKGEVIDKLQSLDLELGVDDMVKQLKQELNSIPVKCHTQRYVTPKVLEWLDENYNM